MTLPLQYNKILDIINNKNSSFIFSKNYLIFKTIPKNNYINNLSFYFFIIIFFYCYLLSIFY